MSDWYVAYTQPNGEARALEHLRRQGYVTYLPRYRRMVRRARRRSVSLRPLFPRHVFILIDRGRQLWHPIRSTRDVVGLVMAGDGPVPVSSEIVDGLLRREREGAVDLVSPIQRLRPGDTVRLIEGPFSDVVGRLLGMADDERIFVLLELLGRGVRAEVPLHAIEAA